MATIKTFLSWLERDLGGRQSFGDVVEYVSIGGAGVLGGNSEETLRVRIYTDNNRYNFQVVERIVGGLPSTGGYLGCTASSRKPRAGEEQHRGNDLPDGPLDEQTWLRILAAIVAYEVVRVHGRTLARSGVIGSKLYDGPMKTEPPCYRDGIGPDRPVHEEEIHGTPGTFSEPMRGAQSAGSTGAALGDTA